jgi:hypothetical protein
MSRAPPVVAPPLVLRPDWKTLAWLTLRWSKPPNLDACPAPNHSPVGFVTQPIKRNLLNFEAQTKKPSQWFWGLNYQIKAAGFDDQTEKPSTLVLRVNQEIHAPHLLVHGTDHTRYHLTSRSSDHWVPDLCFNIHGPLHQVSYFWLDLYRCPSCLTCHLHAMRQVNAILYPNQRIKLKLSKYPGFKFKPWYVNDYHISN